MNTAKEIAALSEAQIIRQLSTDVQPWSPKGVGLAARLQQIQLDRLSKQIGDLIAVAEAQRVLAATLERQTNKIIWLTWALAILTAALLVHEILK